MNYPLFKKYFHKIKLLGEGASGSVYLAVINQKWKGLEKGTKVAIKEYKKDIFLKEKNRAVIKRRIREATTESNVNHPNVVRIYNTKEFWRNKRPEFIVMEYLAGQSLEEFVKNKSLSLGEIFNIANQITDGLMYLHNNKIIHRDLKPVNVHICPNNRVVILDLGVIRPENENTFTSSQTFLGTLRFSAPEWLFREECTTKSDIYSLGSIFYYMLYCKHIFSEINLYSRLVISIKENTVDVKVIRKNIELMYFSYVVKAMLDKSPKIRPSLKNISSFIKHKKESSLWISIRNKILKDTFSIDLKKSKINKLVTKLYNLDFIDKLILSNKLYLLCQNPLFVKILVPNFKNDIIKGYLTLSKTEKNNWINEVYKLTNEKYLYCDANLIEFRYDISSEIQKQEKDNEIISNNRNILDEVINEFTSMIAQAAQENP